MKLKISLLCGITACVMMLSACSTGTNDDQTGTTTTTTTKITTTTTTAATTTTPVTTTTDGEYVADEDGLVTDGNVSTGDDRPDVPDTGVSTDDGKEDNTASSKERSVRASALADEAAFASSYIDMTSLSFGKIAWGLGKEKDSANRPIDAVNAENKYASMGGRFLTDGKRICLTFDEGYENGYTASILDTLNENGVKAVFFVTYDYCLRSPELVRRMIDEGHTVGNHTKTHPSMPDCTKEQMKEEIMFLHDYVKENFGYEMSLFRFPMGEFSEESLDVVNSSGYTSLFWSFAYSDWDTESQPDPTAALEKIENSTHSGIYLLHAVSRTNAEILGELLKYWRENGYEVGVEF